MQRPTGETHSLFDGVILGQDSYLFIGVEDARAEERNSHGIIWKLASGQWNSVEINETLISCALTGCDDYYFVAIAETGKEFLIGDNGVVQNVIASGPHSPASNGPLTHLACVSDREVLAIGTGRQVYRKVGVSEWDRHDVTCKPEQARERARVAFLGIDGYAADDLYAVGWDGQIWHFDGSSWEQTESPTRLMLLSVRCCSGGDVYACGQEGTLLRRRGSEWRVVEQRETRESLRDIQEFEGTIYTCSTSSIYELRDDALVPVAVGEQARTFGKLKVANRRLLSVGLKDALTFDGAGWERLF